MVKVNETTAVYRITDLEENERPRERLAQLGAQSLKTSELLAILIRVGIQGENAVQIGERLLQDLGGLRGLHRISFEEFCSQRGLGPAKAAQIKAAIEIGRRLAHTEDDERAAVHSPSDAAELVKYEMSAFEQEVLRVILLDTRNRVLQIEEVYQGSLNMSMVRIGELFKHAIRRNAAAMIVVHNHPSGDPTPSPEDVALTREIVRAGKLLDIDVLDHLVIAGGRHVSLKERGLGFTEG
ncbi:MAG: DNA repair protein RadC [Chloroflexi bacterium]|nr:DNA repair protein RadC [Chloroflexota bacterium]